MAFKRKAIVVGAFALRLPIVAVAALRLHYLGIQIHSLNPTLHGVIAVILTEIQLQYSIISCLTCSIRPFISAVTTNYGATAINVEVYESVNGPGTKAYGAGTKAYGAGSKQRSQRSNRESYALSSASKRDKLLREATSNKMRTQTYSTGRAKNGTESIGQETVAKDSDDYAQAGPYVEAKYMGSIVDQREMSMLGRTQVLRRNFHFVSVLGFGCTLIGTWEFLLSLIQFGLTDGGTAGLIYGFIICVIGFTLVYLSISEMASMAPTSGGQYHWVSEFAPPAAQKYLSYISGYLVATGWQCSIAGTAFLSGTIIQGLVVLNDSTYVMERWHGTMIVIGVAIFCVLFNIFLAKRLPLVEALLLIIYIVGVFAIVIPLWVLAPRGDAHTVFTQFSNSGGWSTTGTAVMIGFSGTIASLAGFDCAVHMSEEIKNASETLPRAIMSGVAVNGVLGFLMVITLCFTLGDIENILATPTGYPFIQIFFNATQSYVATNIMTSIVIIVFTSAVISELATSSRQLWSFARDGGLPFSSYIAKVNHEMNIPLNAVLVSLVITILMSLINIGSNVALNAIESIIISAFMSSYMITIACVLWKRIKGEPLPARRFSLGRYGMAINIASLVFLLPLFFFSFFPLATPVTAKTMNWNSAMFGGVIVLATAYYWVWGRKQYTPPVALVKREQYEI
ncbi:hypothetical protein DV736_g5784, partial [Chaetothyriales sp. CBS 134916]